MDFNNIFLETPITIREEYREKEEKRRFLY